MPRQYINNTTQIRYFVAIWGVKSERNWLPALQQSCRIRPFREQFVRSKAAHRKTTIISSTRPPRRHGRFDPYALNGLVVRMKWKDALVLQSYCCCASNTFPCPWTTGENIGRDNREILKNASFQSFISIHSGGHFAIFYRSISLLIPLKLDCRNRDKSPSLRDAKATLKPFEILKATLGVLIKYRRSSMNNR